MKVKIFLVASLFLTLFSTIAYSENNIQHTVKTNRYTHTDTTPETSQENLLSVVVTTQFPTTVKTIGEALKFILPQSGYRLDETDKVGDSQYYLYELLLPETQRTFDTVTLRSILEVLGNESYTLNVNPVKRTISYQLLERYTDYIDSDEIASAKRQWLSRKNPITDNEKIAVTPVPIQTTPVNPVYYGPVILGESLSSIAYSLSHYDASADKIMTAIYLKNPSSFLKQNINLLLEGARLVLPRESFVKSISTAQAEELVRLHHERWRSAYQGRVAF